MAFPAGGIAVIQCHRRRINIPLENIEECLDEFRYKNGVLIYCINGSRTLRTEPVLLANDIENVYHLEGSLQGWLKAKHPIENGA